MRREKREDKVHRHVPCYLVLCTLVECRGGRWEERDGESPGNSKSTGLCRSAEREDEREGGAYKCKSTETDVSATKDFLLVQIYS